MALRLQRGAQQLLQRACGSDAARQSAMRVWSGAWRSQHNEAVHTEEEAARSNEETARRETRKRGGVAQEGSMHIFDG